MKNKVNLKSVLIAAAFFSAGLLIASFSRQATAISSLARDLYVDGTTRLNSLSLAEALVIPAGRVGIGTSSPETILDVHGDLTLNDGLSDDAVQNAASPKIIFDAQGVNYGYAQDYKFESYAFGSGSSGLLRIRPADSSSGGITMNAGGSIGINNATPSYRLDVSGNGRFTGSLVVPTPTSASHAANKAYVDGTKMAFNGIISGDSVTMQQVYAALRPLFPGYNTKIMLRGQGMDGTTIVHFYYAELIRFQDGGEDHEDAIIIYKRPGISMGVWESSTGSFHYLSNVVLIY